jgi:acyl-CoA dehydrogenase
MTNFHISERLTVIAPQIKDFLFQEIYPLEKNLLSQPFKEVAKLLAPKREIVRKMGWWAPQMPVELGGQGFSLVDLAHLSEILGSSPLGHYAFNCQAPDSGNMELLLAHASALQKEKFLRPLVKGDSRSCFSMTEPQFAGSDPTQMATKAVLDKDHYVINGHKWFTSSADGADFAVVMAITDAQNANPYKRASLFIVPTDTEGFELVRNISVMGEKGDDYISHAEIRYNNCRIPAEYLIGKEGSGFTLAQERLGPGRIHHCMRWIGICERAFDLMCKRAASRYVKGNTLLGNMQSVQNWIAECRVEINASRLLVLDTAHKMDRLGAKAAREEISAIKFYVAGVLQKVLDRAIQTHGALGVTDDIILSFWYRHERGARIYDGPDEVHKSVLARGILKKYLSD